MRCAMHFHAFFFHRLHYCGAELVCAEPLEPGPLSSPSFWRKKV
jgi:hypothetical protein